MNNYIESLLSCTDEDLHKFIYNFIFIRYHIISKEYGLYEFRIYDYDMYTAFTRISFKVIYNEKINDIIEVHDCRIFDTDDSLFYKLFKDKQEIIRILNDTICTQEEGLSNLIKNIRKDI